MADTGGIAQDQLRSIVARIERLEEEKTVLATDRLKAMALISKFCVKLCA